jgi:hypothetical protein
VNLTTVVNYNHDISMVYKEKNLTNRLLLTQTFGFNYNKNNFDMGVTGGLTYNNARYHYRKTNTDYLHKLYDRLRYTLLKKTLLLLLNSIFLSILVVRTVLIKISRCGMPVSQNSF